MQANDPVQLERWQRLMSSVTANWIGGAMSNYAADSGAILAEVQIKYRLIHLVGLG